MKKEREKRKERKEERWRERLCRVEGVECILHVDFAAVLQ